MPQLRDRKAVLDMHMNIATALLKGIKERQLDNFYQMEENIARQTKAQILEAINDPDKKNPIDKMRAFIIWYEWLRKKKEIKPPARLHRFLPQVSKLGERPQQSRHGRL